MKVGAKKYVKHLTHASYHKSESPNIQPTCGTTGRTPCRRGSALGQSKRKERWTWWFSQITPFVSLCEILLQLLYSCHCRAKGCYKRSASECCEDRKVKLKSHAQQGGPLGKDFPKKIWHRTTHWLVILRVPTIQCFAFKIHH